MFDSGFSGEASVGLEGTVVNGVRLLRMRAHVDSVGVLRLRGLLLTNIGM